MGWSAFPGPNELLCSARRASKELRFGDTARQGAEEKKNRVVCFPEVQAAVSNSATILLHGTAGLPSPLRATRPACSSALMSSKAFL